MPMAGISDLNESDLIKKWKISFQKLVPEQFPAHHRRSFQIIASLGSTNFRSYSLHNNRSEIWRTETRGNAQQLVKKASGLAGNCASEYQWRLELEPIVYKRFELEIYWYVHTPFLYSTSNFLQVRRLLVQVASGGRRSKLYLRLVVQLVRHLQIVGKSERHANVLK
jgi:hypothetical protein